MSDFLNWCDDDDAFDMFGAPFVGFNEYKFLGNLAGDVLDEFANSFRHPTCRFCGAHLSRPDDRCVRCSGG